MGYPLASSQQELTPLQSSFLIEAALYEREQEIAAEERADSQRQPGRTQPPNSSGEAVRSRQGIAGKPHAANARVKKPSLTDMARQRRGGSVGKRTTKFKKRR